MTENELLTDLFGGKRVPKDDPRIELCGTIDEANSALGLARAIAKSDVVSSIIYQVQQELFIVGAECATPLDHLNKLPRRVTTDNVQRLKQLTDQVEKEMTPAEGFVIPGNTPSSAALHLSRSVIRRAERIAVRLRREGQISKDVLSYLDQLSSLLFSLARFEAQARK